MTTIEDMRAAAHEAADAMSEMILAVAKAIGECRADPQKAPEVLAAIKNVLRTVGEMPMPAAAGVEFDMAVYLKCDAVDATTCLRYPGNRMMPPRSGDPVDVAELIDALPLDQRVKLMAIGNWRVMTRREITQYKVDAIRRAEGRG